MIIQLIVITILIYYTASILEIMFKLRSTTDLLTSIVGVVISTVLNILILRITEFNYIVVIIAIALVIITKILEQRRQQ